MAQKLNQIIFAGIVDSMESQGLMELYRNHAELIRPVYFF